MQLEPKQPSRTANAEPHSVPFQTQIWSGIVKIATITHTPGSHADDSVMIRRMQLVVDALLSNTNAMFFTAMLYSLSI